MLNSSQSDYVVQIILKSGMLLDEDMDYVLIHYKSTEVHPKGMLSATLKILGGISLASTVFFVQQKLPIGYIITAAAPIVIVAVQQINEVFYRRRQRRDTEELIKVITDICKMNRDIVKYFKQKTSSNTASAVNMYTVNVKTFIEILFMEEVLLLKTCRQFVEKVSSYLPSLLFDYFQLLKNIDLEEFRAADITDINGCITYILKLCDIYLVIASNTLTSLAVSSFLSNEYDVTVDEILNIMVPLKNQSLACYKGINNKFIEMKYYYLNNKVKIISKIQKVDSSSRLYQKTYDMLAGCSDIVEKSQIILKKLEKHSLTTVYEKQMLHDCISDLCGQVSEYYESMNILEKLYEVEISKSMPAVKFTQDRNTEAPIKSLEGIENVIDASLNPTEPDADEEYELFVTASDNADLEPSDCNYYEDESRKYASVLCRELRQKLKEDSRFRAAQQKRGIVDDEVQKLKTDSFETKTVPQQGPFQFTAKPLLTTVQCSSQFESVIPPPPELPPFCVKSDDFEVKPIPPPPPLPLSLIDIGPFADTVQHAQSGINFLQSIQDISTGRQMREDVFECSEVEEQN